MGTTRPWGSFLLKLAQFPLFSCTNRIYSCDKVKYQLQQYLIVYRLAHRVRLKTVDIESFRNQSLGAGWKYSIAAADVYRLDQEYGGIEGGKFTDLVILSDDCLSMN